MYDNVFTFIQPNKLSNDLESKVEIRMTQNCSHENTIAIDPEYADVAVELEAGRVYSYSEKQVKTIELNVDFKRPIFIPSKRAAIILLYKANILY